MRAMFDASCPKCGKRFGWRGEAIDRPPCPACGHQIDRAVIERDQAEIEKSRRMLGVTTPETESGQAEAVWLQDWLPGAYVYVGRQSPNFPGYDGLWGNPFGTSRALTVLVHTASGDEAVELYRRWLAREPAVDAMLPPAEAARRERILAELPTLRGKRLACHFHRGNCHAQVLAELANAIPAEEPKNQPAGRPAD